MSGLGKMLRAPLQDCNDQKTIGRHDYLSAISRLPHVDVALRRELGLQHTIEAEIIPRLMLAYSQRLPTDERRSTSPSTVMSEDIKTFSAIICSNDLLAARAFIFGLQSRNVPVDAILLELLAPTANLLGEMWEEDDADFTEVTIALCCLQQILRDISCTTETEVPGAKAGYRALLAPVPGEQHIFSVLMVDEFFRRAKWDVWTMPAATEDELLDILARENFDMTGLSVSCEAWLPRLESLIARMRSVSLNRDLIVLVGGKPFSDDPSLAVRLGADATARDGRNAVMIAETTVDKIQNMKMGEHSLRSRMA